jgi:hypothetical protein
MNTGMWYLRMYTFDGPRDPRDFSKPPKYRYLSQIVSVHDLLKAIQNQKRIDAVSLDTGVAARHDYKKPLAEWLKDPLLRQMAATTGKVP